jgi:PadR family transcriptional regulator, regulatory protein AphA
MPSRNIASDNDEGPPRDPGALPVTSFAVLGQLAAGPATGYEVQSRLRTGAAHFWHASYSQIYAELRRLERLGYASQERVVQERRPNKRVYTITESGRRALVDWLERPWGLAHLRDESLVKLMLADPLPTVEVIAQVRRLLETHERRRAEFEEEIARLPADAGRYLRLALRKGVRAQEAFAGWCREVIEELERDQGGPEDGASTQRGAVRP